MNKIIRIFYMSVLIFACSGSTRLTVSYTSGDLQPKKYNKLAIVALTNSDPNRLVLEEAMVDQFNRIGVHAVSTFNIFPLAGRPDVLSEMDLDEETIKNHIRETVKKNNIDALMLISLLDSKQVERYVSDPSAGVYYFPPYPAYAYHYYDYYYYVHRQTHSQGYYTTATTYFVEINLYDIETEELIWTGQTKTENISSIEAEAPNFARIVVRDIQYKKVLSL